MSVQSTAPTTTYLKFSTYNDFRYLAYISRLHFAFLPVQCRIAGSSVVEQHVQVGSCCVAFMVVSTLHALSQVTSSSGKAIRQVLNGVAPYFINKQVVQRWDAAVISTTRGLSCDKDPRAVSSARPQPDAVFARVYAEFLAVEW
ncbi:hypothetical protein MRX96_052743 [Rhipicephalus microplus]